MVVPLQITLYIIALLFFLTGLFATAEAKSAIHQIYAALEFGFAALILGALMITHAINTFASKQAAPAQRVEPR